MSAHVLARLLGMMNATNNVIPPAPFFYPQLQMTLSSTLERHSQSYEAQITLTQDYIQERKWWNHNIVQLEWQDTSEERSGSDHRLGRIPTGLGGVLQPTKDRGSWSTQECAFHINCLELLAATLAVQTFAKNKTGLSILLRIDNTTIVA